MVSKVEVVLKVREALVIRGVFIISGTLTAWSFGEVVLARNKSSFPVWLVVHLVFLHVCLALGLVIFQEWLRTRKVQLWL